MKLIYDEEIVHMLERNPDAQAEDLPEQLSNDPMFVAKLMESLKKWGQLASILMHHSQEVVFESLKSEKDFWKNYKQSLVDLEKQLKSPETTLTVNILKAKKKFTKKNDIVEEINLRQKIDNIQKICDIIGQINIDIIEQSSQIRQLL